MPARPDPPLQPAAPTLRLLDGKAMEPPDLEPPPSSQPSRRRMVARHHRGFVFLDTDEIRAFQAAGRRTFVHSPQGKFEMDASLVDIETSFCFPLTRVHRNWLVNPWRVRAFERAETGTTLFVGNRLGDEKDGIHVPVARDLVLTVRAALLANATGLRERATRTAGRRSE